MPTPLRSVRLSDESWNFLEGLKMIYGTADKGMLAISRICTPEVLAAGVVTPTNAIEEDVKLSKPEMIDFLKAVIQNIESKPLPVTQDKPKARAESVAERKAREQREHVAKLAESDTLARAVGR